MRLTMFAGLLLIAGSAIADDPKNMAFEPSLKTVAIFQDGFGYYVREGRVKLEDGWATAKSVPTAVRGTIWVYPGDPADSIELLQSVKSNVIDAKGAEAIKKALENKIGLQLSIDASGKNFSGKLSKLLDDMILLDIGGAFTAIRYDAIQKIMLVGYPLRIKLATEDKEKVTTIGMSYIQEGVRWEPSYVLEMKGKGMGTLTLRGNILNLPEALSSTDVLFVVGSPHLSNRGQGETFVAGTEPAELKEAEKGDAGFATKAPGMTATPPPPLVSLAGEGAGELFYYTKPSLSLEKGDIAMVTIFQHTTPVTPQFEWLADGDELSYILKIENRSGQPFTNGPVFVIEDGKPVGQETIKYTPSGSYAELRLARGIGLRTERTDVEVERGKVVTIGQTQFLPVIMKGTLKVTNFRKADAPIKITRTVRGKLTKVGGGGVVKDTQVFTGDPNAVYKVEWQSVVPAEGTLVLEYDYETYTAVAKLGGPPVPGGPDGF